MSELEQGTAVNIVLKADQPTGKLTTGTIADFLTRGNHPRGIKVRLSDGKIGRVRSLASNTQSGAPQSAETGSFQTRRSGAETGHGIQRDYRTEEQPAEDVSLLDYVQVKQTKKSRGKRKGTTSSVEDEPSQHNETEAMAFQQRMEAEFPNLDASLVAAILSDQGSAEVARRVLAGLS